MSGYYVEILMPLKSEPANIAIYLFQYFADNPVKKRAEPPRSQYAGTAAGGHDIHILSLMQNSSHSEEGKGWVG